MTEPLDPAVTRARWAAFVDRALRRARDNGISDRKIQDLSGVATSTFHRWRKGDNKGLPKLPQVRAFCAATGADLNEAMHVLGMTTAAPASTPDAPLPEDVRIIMRRLADPNTPEIDKQFIRMSLRMLAARLPSGAEASSLEDAG